MARLGNISISSRLFFVFGVAFLVAGGYLLWLDFELFSSVDSCLDSGGSFNYDLRECDFTQSHEYKAQRSYSLWGIACLIVGLGGLDFARGTRVSNAV
jgi:hypothetical protein